LLFSDSQLHFIQAAAPTPPSELCVSENPLESAAAPTPHSHPTHFGLESLAIPFPGPMVALRSGGDTEIRGANIIDSGRLCPEEVE